MFEPTKEDFKNFNLKAYKERLLKAQAQAKLIDYNYIDREYWSAIEAMVEMVDSFLRHLDRIKSTDLELKLIKEDLVSNSKMLQTCEHGIDSFLWLMKSHIMTNKKHMKPYLKLVKNDA